MEPAMPANWTNGPIDSDEPRLGKGSSKLYQD